MFPFCPAPASSLGVADTRDAAILSLVQSRPHLDHGSHPQRALQASSPPAPIPQSPRRSHPPQAPAQTRRSPPSARSRQKRGRTRYPLRQNTSHPPWSRQSPNCHTHPPSAKSGYVHEPLSGEFPNVGVLLWAPGARFLGFKASQKFRRLSHFLHGFPHQV